MKSCDDITLQLLVEKTIVAPEVLDSLKDSSDQEQTLIERLIAAGHTSDSEVLRLLADEFCLSLSNLEDLQPDRIVRQGFDRSLALEK